MTSAQEIRESRKKSLIKCINNGIINKKDIIRKTGMNIHVIYNLWIEDDVQDVLKKMNRK